MAALSAEQQARVSALATEVELVCIKRAASVMEILSLAGAMIVRQAEHPDMTPAGRKAITDIVDNVRHQVVEIGRQRG